MDEVLTSPTLTYDQRLRQLAALAMNAMPYPELSRAVPGGAGEAGRLRHVRGQPALRTALRAARLRRSPCARAARTWSWSRPADLDDALSFLTVLYGHVPSVTTYPVYLGDLDTLLAPYVTDELTDAELDAKLRRFWIQLDRLLPDAFVHTDLGPDDSRVARSILRVERSLRQVVPNITLKVDPGCTPDDLVEDGVRTVFETGKPHFVNHPMMVGDHGERYAAVSCYNSLKIGGGSHTLTRLNLKEAALRHEGGLEAFCERDAPALRRADRGADGGADPLAGRARSGSSRPAGWPPRG